MDFLEDFDLEKFVRIPTYLKLIGSNPTSGCNEMMVFRALLSIQNCLEEHSKQLFDCIIQLVCLFLLRSEKPSTSIGWIHKTNYLSQIKKSIVHLKAYLQFMKMLRLEYFDNLCAANSCGETFSLSSMISDLILLIFSYYSVLILCLVSSGG